MRTFLFKLFPFVKIKKSKFELKMMKQQKKPQKKLDELMSKFNDLPTEERHKFIEEVKITFHSCSIENSTLTERECFILLLKNKFK